MPYRVFTLIFIFFTCSLHAQEKSSLINELERVSEETGMLFSYDYDLLEGIPSPSIKVKGKPLQKLLNELQEKSLFSFTLVDSSVLVSLKAEYYSPEITIQALDEDGATIPGLNVAINNTIVSQTDLDGKTTVVGAYNIKDEVAVFGLGFDTISKPLYYFLGTSKQSVLVIPSSTYELATLVIEGYMSSGINADFTEQKRVVETNDMALLPGEIEGDVLRSIQTLPGIKSSNGRAGNLFINGSSPDQNLILIDGIPVYHFGHYFGTISPYNPKIVEKIEVSTSGYSAERGGKVGGVIDIITENDIRDSAKYGLGINTLYAGAYAITPTKNKKAQLLLSARASYPVSWQPPKLEAITESVFTGSQLAVAMEGDDNLQLDDFEYHFDDVNAKLLLEPTSKDKISLSGIRVNNLMKYEASDDVRNNYQSNIFKLNNIGMSTAWKRIWGTGGFTKVSIAYSDYDVLTEEQVKNQDDDMVIRNGVATNDIKDFKAVVSLGKTFRNGAMLTTGYEYSAYNVGFEFEQIIRDSNQKNVRDESGDLHAVYFDYQFNNWKRLKVIPGFRLNYFEKDQNLYPEPRLFMNYQLSEKMLLKSSYGIFHQFVSQVINLNFSTAGFDNQLWVVANGEDVKVTNTDCYMLGTVFHSNGWVIDLEGFYKDSKNVPIFEHVSGGSKGFFPAKAYSIGGNLMVKKRWNNQLDTWISYSLSTSKLQVDTLGAEETNNYYDQPHIFNAVVLYKIKRWKFSAGWNLSSGLPTNLAHFSPFLSTRSQGRPPGGGGGPGGGGPGGGDGPASNQQESGEFEGDRYPWMHSLDVSLVYGFPQKAKKWRGSLGLSIVNVYDQENLIGQQTRRSSGGEEYINYYAIGFSPNLAFNLEW